MILLDAIARKDPNINNGSVHARRYAQRRVLYVRRFLTENCSQKLFFRRKLRLALRRHLADENVAGFDFGANKRDAGFV